mmetsp:Transcript_86054/g.230293  ORF Transcript_86054/g.230293 Transcript_86054/m.230293 type:complete len:255 (-) Transcript_86054:1150-1914(-)
MGTDCTVGTVLDHQVSGVLTQLKWQSVYLVGVGELGNQICHGGILQGLRRDHVPILQNVPAVLVHIRVHKRHLLHTHSLTRAPFHHSRRHVRAGGRDDVGRHRRHDTSEGLELEVLLAPLRGIGQQEPVLVGGLQVAPEQLHAAGCPSTHGDTLEAVHAAGVLLRYLDLQEASAPSRDAIVLSLSPMLETHCVVAVAHIPVQHELEDGFVVGDLAEVAVGGSSVADVRKSYRSFSVGPVSAIVLRNTTPLIIVR